MNGLTWMSIGYKCAAVVMTRFCTFTFVSDWNRYATFGNTFTTVSSSFLLQTRNECAVFRFRVRSPRLLDEAEHEFAHVHQRIVHEAEHLVEEVVQQVRSLVNDQFLHLQWLQWKSH